MPNCQSHQHAVNIFKLVWVHEYFQFHVDEPPRNQNLNCWSKQEKNAIILTLFISIQFETRTFHEQFAATKRSKTLPFAVISNPSVCNNQHHLSQYFYLFVSSSSSSSSLSSSRPKPTYDRQGLAGCSIRASGALLESGK